MANKQIDELSGITTISGSTLLVAYDGAETGSEKTKKVLASDIRVPALYQTSTDYLVLMVGGTNLNNVKFVRFIGGCKPEDPNSFRFQFYVNNDSTEANYRGNLGATNNMCSNASMDYVSFDVLFNVDTKIVFGQLVYEYNNSITSIQTYMRHIVESAVTELLFYTWDAADQDAQRMTAGSMQTWLIY